MVSRLRTDEKRDHDAAKSATAADWSLQCGSLDTNCSVLRVDYNPTDMPAFFADPRCEFMTFTLPKPRMYISPLPASLLTSCSFVANACSTCTGKGRHHKIGVGAPKLFIIGDEFCPPMVGENGDCCPTIRVRGGCFKDVKKIIDLQIHLGLNIPPRSVAVVFLLSHLLKAGHDKYWIDYSDFCGWAKKTNLITIPCLQPYPSLDADKLNTIRQYYCRLQLQHHGDNTKGKNHRFAFWMPFTNTANTSEHAKIEPVHMSNFFLRSSNSPVSATGDFCSGFGSLEDWDKGMPCDVEKTFFQQLFKTLREHIHYPDIAASDLRIPADSAVLDGIHDIPDDSLAHMSGKKVFCMGASIIEKARLQLFKQASIYKFEVVSLCWPGKYLKFFHKQNLDTYLAPLAAGKEDDIIYISVFGNEMLNKTRHHKDPKDPQGIFHLISPSLLTGGEFNILVADAMHLINAVKKRFRGSIFILGPTPRHLTKCCDDQSHQILDAIGVKPDMLSYCEVFNDQLKICLPLPSDTYFVDFRQIFGAEFRDDMTPDKVHLHDAQCRVLANFLLRGHEVLLPAPPLLEPDASFDDAMRAVEICVPAAEKEKEPVESEFNFDNLDYEA